MTDPPQEAPIDRDSRTTSFGLVRYAEDYRRGAMVVWDAERPRLTMVPYMLIAHSIELSLKAFLRSRGATLKALKNQWGHTLPELLDHALSQRLDRLVPGASTATQYVQWLHEANDEQSLRYIRTGWTRLPDWEVVSGFAAALTSGLHDHCLRRTIGREGAKEAIRNRGSGFNLPPLPEET